ncbi:MAG: hypothetical protein Q4G25_02205 [Paracoccus sp. (in: a-proteobacteria)]|nr:hypothetical protein [Paracoccus sp. (in: a-proteobacteria)]
MIKALLPAAFLAAALCQPADAQMWRMPRADAPPPVTQDSPADSFETELDGIMEGLFQRMRPHLEGLGNELAGTLNEFGPALNELSGLVDDISNYQRPERLENGDIIIRRRAEAPPPPPLDELQRLLPEREGRDRPATPGRDGRTDPWRHPLPGGTVPDLPQTDL